MKTTFGTIFVTVFSETCDFFFFFFFVIFQNQSVTGDVIQQIK